MSTQLREQDEKTWYRVLYVRRANEIQVLHCFEKRSNIIEQKDIETAKARLKRVLEAEREEKENPNRRSAEGEYRVEGSVLDELGLDRQAALELKLKAALHQNILQLVKRRGYRARDLERILRVQEQLLSK